MLDEAATKDEFCVRLLAPTQRDREATQALLAQAQIACRPCADVAALAVQCQQPTGAVLLTDAAFADPRIDQLLAAFGNQRSWSDTPVILLCRPGPRTNTAARVLGTLHNVTILERPTTSRTLLSSVQAALRARRRQYQLSEQFEALRASEVALRDRERQLHTLADNSPDILSRFDRQLRHVFINSAGLAAMGLQRSEVLGRTSRELGMPEHLCTLWENALERVFESGKSLTIEFEYEGRNGRRDFVNALVPERDYLGSVETVLCVAHDVTDKRRAELALQAANRRKDEFLAMLAHELRNPLAPIRNAAEYLARTCPQESHIKAADIVRRQVAHMTRLIDDLLDVSRITEGRIQLHRQTLEIGAVITDALESVEPLMRERKHTLLVSSTYQPLHVSGDRARLVQCLVNVLTNAAKYTDPGGEIRVDVRRQDAGVVLVITDNGMGISPELLPSLFELFVQGDRSLDRSQGGLGIGLSVVRRLIEMHGGEVSAESAGLGCGSSFQIRLPIVEAPAAASQDEIKPSVHRRRILIVDDNADSADSLALNLELDGHETKVVYRSVDALECVQPLQPDIILLDIGLPEMNGYEVAARIRSIQLPVTIIALTGYGQHEDIQRARAAGFDAHIIKPVDFGRLARLIAEFSGRSA
jgi:PAS domain S-box-containing protein